MSENPSPVVVRAKPKKSGKRKTKTQISEQNDQLSVEQKKTLAAFVKANTLLWSLQDPNHKKADKQIETWAKIALDMGVNVETCKRGWKSLKDGLRYRSFGNKVKKSGDSGDEGEFDEPEYSEAGNDNALESWCFWDDLKFLSEARPGRSTMSTIDLEDQSNSNQSVENQESSAQENIPNPTEPEAGNSKSNYQYMNRKRKPDQDMEQELLSGLNDLVKMRKDSTRHEPNRNEDLKYYSMYSNLDRMLKKLPEPVVEDLNMEFINMAYNCLKKFDRTTFTP